MNSGTIASPFLSVVTGVPLIDGEIVVLDSSGKSDFQSLQYLMRQGTDADAVYFAFDLPFFAGRDLTDWRLEDRKALLSGLLTRAGVALGERVRLSDHIAGAEVVPVDQHARPRLRLRL